MERYIKHYCTRTLSKRLERDMSNEVGEGQVRAKLVY
jgi:hypothetical protein